MIRIEITLLLLFSCARLHAATRYLDAAASGANNGASWTDAWQNPTNVLLNPGDTLYISQGTYTNSLLVTNGTASARTVVSHSSDAGHDGPVIFDGARIYMQNSPSYVTIDGGLSTSFTPPTDVDHVRQITNNIGITIQNLLGTTSSDLDPVVWYFTGTAPHDVTIQYVGVTGISNSYAYLNAGIDPKGTIAYFNNVSGIATNVLFQYLWLRGNACQQFGGGGSSADAYGAYQFSFGIIEQQAEDTFEVGGGWSIHDSIIGPANSYAVGKVHEDHFQFTGDFIKVYNNLIYEGENSIFRYQTLASGTPLICFRHDFQFFNNRITEKEGRAAYGGVLTEPGCIVNFDPLHPASQVIISNWVFANNLWYNCVSNTGQGYAEVVRNPVIYWDSGHSNASQGKLVVTNASVVASLFVNNLVVDRQKGISFPASTNYDSSKGYSTLTTNDFWADYNIMASVKPNLITPRQWFYMDVVSNLEAHPFKFSNSTNYPAFTDATNENFELLPGDTAALNTGYNLSAYFNFDALNRPRNAGGAWDRGPLELQASTLLVHLEFESNFNLGYLYDSSGSGNHAYRFGRPGSVYPTNFPSQAPASATPGLNTNNAGYCADFRWHTNSDYGLYGRDGDYGAITNVAAFTNLSEMTVAVWARYDTVKRIGSSYDYSQDGNACLISAGTSTAVIGAWDFGRFNQALWINNTRFYLVTNSNFGIAQSGTESDPVFEKAGKVVFNFPDYGFNNGDTTNWNHYAITFSNGVIRSYYNGTNLATADVSTITTRATVGWNPSVTAATAFLGIGCDTHGGTPALEDETGVDYPNNGFFNGQMDDVRIYSTALSGSEIAALANYSAPAPNSLTTYRARIRYP